MRRIHGVTVAPCVLCLPVRSTPNPQGKLKWMAEKTGSCCGRHGSSKHEDEKGLTTPYSVDYGVEVNVVLSRRQEWLRRSIRSKESTFSPPGFYLNLFAGPRFAKR